jgi:hypothetical protein
MENSGQFKPGHKAVSPGRKALPAETHDRKADAYNQYINDVLDVREMTPADILSIDMENTPLGRRHIMQVYAKNDVRGIKDCEDRVFGKAKETIDLGLNPDNELNQYLIDKLNAIRKKALES